MNTTTNQDETNNSKSQVRKITYWEKYREKWIDPLVIVTILLAVATFALYREAANEGETAEKSADAAIKAANIAKATLDEQKIEFQKVNAPFLNIANCQIATLGIDKKVLLNYVIQNLGNQPVHTDSMNMNLYILDTIVGRNKQKIDYIFSKINDNNPVLSYYIDKSTAASSFQRFNPLNAEQLKAVQNVQKLFYIAGFIYYTNLVTDKPAVYKFYIELYSRLANKNLEDTYAFFLQQKLLKFSYLRLVLT